MGATDDTDLPTAQPSRAKTQVRSRARPGRVRPSSGNAGGNAGRKARTRPQPRQERSRAMVELILETTWMLLDSEGYDQTTTNRIAERAGISIGSLYQYFANKAAILDELQRRHHAEIHAVMEAAFQQAAALPLEPALRRMVRANFDAHRIAPEFHRVLEDQIPRAMNRSTLLDLRTMLQGELETWLARALPDLPPPRITALAFLIRTLVESVTHETLCGDPAWHGRAEEIEAEVCAMILAHLG